MSDAVIIGGVLAAVLLLVIIINLGLAQAIARARARALKRLAGTLGLTYARRRNVATLQRYAAVTCIPKSVDCTVTNSISGTYSGYPVDIFDYHYRDGNISKESSVLVLDLPRALPTLQIFPESDLDRLAGIINQNDIDFDSVEFSKAFVVKSPDKKFAYDVCHARMMAYLLAHRRARFEISAEYLVAISLTLEPKEIQPKLDLLVNIRSLMPEYLFSTFPEVIKQHG